MIINLIAVDPEHDGHEDRLLQYRVPENSREFQLLTRLFNEHCIEFTTLSSPRRRIRKENEDHD